LPLLYDQLEFELDEETLRQVAKKKSREDLRTKFQQWDEEIVESEAVLMEPILSNNNNNNNINEAPNEYNLKRTKRKVISLSLIKYAVAACVVLTVGVLYFKLSTNTIDTITQPTEDKVVTTEAPKVDIAVLAEITTVITPYNVLEADGFGFAATTQKISVIENNQKARVLSLRKAIEVYEIQSNNELATSDKPGDRPVSKALKDQRQRYRAELEELTENGKQYIFDGKKLILFVSSSSTDNRVLLYEDNYYLKKDTGFYRLTISEEPQFYKRETDSDVLRALDKIIFDNE
jgi:negative regulator of sigma E activity